MRYGIADVAAAVADLLWLQVENTKPKQSCGGAAVRTGD
jgi:hypothetical protein